MRVEEIGSVGVVAVNKDDSLAAAAKQLASDEVGVVVVYDSTEAVGMLSERDVVRAVADEASLDETSVEEYMTESPVTVEASEEIAGAITKMNEFGLRHLGVTRHGEIVGVLSMRDVVALLGTRWPEI